MSSSRTAAWCRADARCASNDDATAARGYGGEMPETARHRCGPRRRGRPARLSREQVVDTVIALLEREPRVAADDRAHRRGDRGRPRRALSPLRRPGRPLRQRARAGARVERDPARRERDLGGAARGLDARPAESSAAVPGRDRPDRTIRADIARLARRLVGPRRDPRPGRTRRTRARARLSLGPRDDGRPRLAGGEHAAVGADRECERIPA